MNTLFTNALIYSFEDIKNGQVAVEGNKIAYVGKKYVGNLKFDRIIDCKGNLLMPGLVNAHAHAGLTFGRGLSDNTSLEDWLYNHIFPMESKLTEEDYYWGTLGAIKEFVRGGITSCLDMYFCPKMVIKAFKNSGYRAVVSVFPREFSDDLIKEEDELIKLCFSLHSVYTTDEHDVIEVMNYSKKYNRPITVHLCETLTEVGNCTAKHDMTPIGYLDSFGFFDYTVIAAHCVHLDRSDMEILRQNNVHVCSCPGSNLKLASGVAPLHELSKKGINVCLGTDSSASNNTLDIFREANLASLLQKNLLTDSTILQNNLAIKFASINGARALGYNNLGEIKVGYLADIILLNISEPNYLPLNNLKDNLIYSVNSKDVYLTMINGNILYENGKYYLAEDGDVISTKILELNKKLNN